MNNTKRKRTLGFRLLMSLLFLMGSLIPTVGLADDGELKFHVKPTFPDSQITDSTSYFDLNLSPGQSDILEVLLQNDSDEVLEVLITAHTAFTNVNGVVEYGKDAENNDPTLPHALDTLIETPDVIRLEAKEQMTVRLPIQMPEEAFEGVLAGGLRIEEVQGDADQPEEATEGLAIKNEFSYILGVVVSNTRSSITPELELLNVYADQLNHRNVFTATIQNYLSTFVNRVEIEAVVRAEGKEEILYEAEQSGIQLAPNSHLNFPISLNGDRFVSGTYVLTMTARSGEYEWEWEEPFTIAADEARRLNREDVTIDSSINWWMVVAIVVFIVLFIGLLYLVYQKKKRKKDYKEKQKRLKERRKKTHKKKQELLKKTAETEKKNEENLDS